MTLTYSAFHSPPNPLTVKCVKHARLRINLAFLSPMRYLLLIRPSVVSWHAFGSASRIHITDTDTSGSEKVIAIATRGNQSWLLVTGHWKAAAELRLAACVYCAQGLAWWHPLFCTQQERGGSRPSWAASVRSSILFKKANFLPASRHALQQQPSQFPSTRKFCAMGKEACRMLI